MADSLDRNRLLTLMNDVADRLDVLFTAGYLGRPAWRNKGDRDPVSETDVAIENRARELLHRARPDIPIVGEETGGESPLEGLAWHVDPIDGTVNFLAGIPLCGISIGLAGNGVPALGLISAPLLGARFAGGPGAPSTENRNPIRAAHVTSLGTSVVSLGDYSTGNGAEERNRHKLAATARLASEAYRVRMVGSAALDLAWVASGRLAGAVILSNKPWDMCAGVAIARGAGAVVVGEAGEPYTLASRAMVAGAPGIIDELAEIVRGTAQATAITT